MRNQQIEYNRIFCAIQAVASLGSQAISRAAVARAVVIRAVVTRAIIVGLIFTGCGGNHFSSTTILEPQTAPGSYTVPPNLDLLVFVDDTGSVLPISESLQAQVSPFLNGLNKREWNFHFAVAPLTQFSMIHQVAGSKFDSGTGAQWIPPYPGAQPGDSGMIAPFAFRTPGDFQVEVQASTKDDGQEAGLENILNVLKRGFGSTGFLRQSSEKVVLMIGNGEDTSRVNYCQHPQSHRVLPCEDLGSPRCVPTQDDPTGGRADCGSDQSSLEYFKSEFKSVLPNLSFYAVVGKKNSQNCQGFPAAKGRRYIEMASELKGKAYDICSTSISAVLEDLTEILQAKEFNFKSQYLFVAHEPDPETIQVMKYENGNRLQGTLLFENAQNGWTYEGYVQDVVVSYDPQSQVPKNRGSGYAIRLNGTAQLTGSDDASIDFVPAGAK